MNLERRRREGGEWTLQDLFENVQNRFVWLKDVSS